MNKRLFASALSLFSILGTIIPVYATNNVELKYALAETEGEIVFHLDNTSIVYDDENLEQDINYHITTTAGNYYLDNESVKNYFYFVEAEETSLSDSHGSSTTIPVEFDSSEAEGTLDLTKTVTDNTTYAGAIGTAIEKEEKAGTYVGRTTILFDAFIPIMSEATGFSYVNRNEESIIVDYDASYGSDITIPDEFEGNTVTEINDQALMSKSLKSVSLSSGVKSIGDEALANNTELTTIELNEGLESIGDKAMANTAVEEIVIPSTVETIGEEALVQETATPVLTKIVNKTGKAFNWTNITKGTTDNEFVVGAVETIEVTYNENVTDGTCFTYSVENNEATITGYDVACGGTDVMVPVTIDGYTVTEIGRLALYNKGLTSIEIPGNVKIIGEGAIAKNPLETVILHEGLETIKGSAFMQVNSESSLTTIEIPSSVKTIEASAFTHNKNLTTVTFNEGLEYVSGFAGTNLSSIELPSTVKYVSGFSDNANLTKVTLNEGLETIGPSAFSSTGITEVVIPSTVKTIDTMAFAFTPTLTNVTLPEGLETIGDYAFQNTSLAEIEIPGSVKTIGEAAFRLNGATEVTAELTTVTFNEGLETIGVEAFSGQSITEVELPSTVKTVGDYAFEFNRSNKIVLNEGLESIGKGAFYGHKVTEITIPSTVTTIGAYSPGTSTGNDAAFGSQNVDVTKIINKTGLAFDWAHILANTMATGTESFVTGEIVWSEPPFAYNQETTYVVSE